jgi:5,10-methylenetetrahydromethanopterin reductase
MERVALYLQDAHDLRDGLDIARYAESRGFEAVWQAESRLVRDAIVPMAAYAAVTERIKIGSGVIRRTKVVYTIIKNHGAAGCTRRP